MHRLTARLLLVLLLVGVFVPVALAISAAPPHACCLRKPLHDSAHNAQFQAPPGCCQHDCCRPLTVSQWAHVTPRICAHVVPVSATLQSERHADHVTTSVSHAPFGRAPPRFSIA